MTRYDLCHRFFHEPWERGEYAGLNVHFHYYESNGQVISWDFYSYNTIIGEVKKDKHGNNVLILSHHRYSSFTSKHISDLWRACPFDVLFMPRVGEGYYGRYMEGMYDFGYILKTIAAMSEKDLRKKENRQYVIKNLQMFDAYVERMSDMSKDLIRKRKSAKVRKVVDMTIEKNEALRLRYERLNSLSPEEQARYEEQRAKRRAAEQKRLEEFINGGDSLKKLRAAFELTSRRRWNESMEHEILREYRDKLRKQTDDRGRWLSYVWLVGDHAETSQRCEAPVSDVKRLLKLWKRRENMVGEHAGHYTVVENTPDYVKVGCHVIPKWNIELLCNELKIAA